MGNNGIGRGLATMVSTAMVAAGMAASPAGAATLNVGCGPNRVAELVGAVTTADASAGSDTINLTAGCTYAFTTPDNY